MDGLGRAAFMKIGAAAFDVDGSALGRRDDVGTVGVARRDDAAAIRNEPVHHGEP